MKKAKQKFRIYFRFDGIYFENITVEKTNWLDPIIYQDYFYPNLNY